MNHLADLSVFALLVSVALAFLSKQTLVERIKYALWTFLAFLAISIALGWLMLPFSH